MKHGINKSVAASRARMGYFIGISKVKKAVGSILKQRIKRNWDEHVVLQRVFQIKISFKNIGKINQHYSMRDLSDVYSWP